MTCKDCKFWDFNPEHSETNLHFQNTCQCKKAPNFKEPTKIDFTCGLFEDKTKLEFSHEGLKKLFAEYTRSLDETWEETYISPERNADLVFIDFLKWLNYGN